MTQYLLAAEADQIQKTIFKSVRLAEIIGGSQQLTNWCSEQAERLKNTAKYNIQDEDILVADGGAFRVVFAREEDSREWGEILAEDYAVQMGGTLTVIEPICFEENSLSGNKDDDSDNKNDFRKASAAAQKELRKIKNNPLPVSASRHNPFINSCDVCGIGLGSIDRQISAVFEEGSKRRIICSQCQSKVQLARESTFLKDFLNRVNGCLQKIAPDFPFPIFMPAESKQLAGLDGRNNIAYLIADGNDMGTIFACCSRQQMHQLSRKLPEIIQHAIVEGTAKMIISIYAKEIEAKNEKPKACPVIPLIIGGDDVNIQLAAPYALDFARLFAQSFVRGMNESFEKIGINAKGASICMGLVICKYKYPHSLAYDDAHEFLSKAKACAKSSKGINSMLAFGFPKENFTDRGIYSKSLQLYKIEEQTTEVEQIKEEKQITEEQQTINERQLTAEQKAAEQLQIANKQLFTGHIDIMNLFDARTKLDAMPQSVLKEWLAFYTTAALPENANSLSYLEWQNGMRHFLERIKQKSAHADSLKQALYRLGSDDKDCLYMRYLNKVFVSGIPDLIRFWDYLHEMGSMKEGDAK